jgi:anti-sigma regulatory factor (Ser/Thr protein kinase)
MIAVQHEWSAAARPLTVREMRHAVAAVAEGAGLSGSVLDDVRTCVSEAVSNAVVHAFPDGRAPGTITVRVEVHADELVVFVHDDGIGFRPRTDSPGLGLGVPTITALAHSMTITVAAGSGTEICMAFTR